MRYFIVFYTGMYSSRSAELSQHIFNDRLVKAKTFPNKELTIKEISEEWGLRYVHILNIKEVTEEEAKQYYP